MNVYDKSNELAKAISQSEEFKKYKELALEIDKNDTHKSMIKDFMKLQYKVSMIQMEGKEITEKDKEEFNLIMSTISNVSIVNEFLNAQMTFGRMIEDISKAISKASDTGAEFLNSEYLLKE